MTMRMGLIGSGISKSRMPRLQLYLASLCALEIEYLLIDGAGVEGFDPVKEIRNRLHDGWRGVNVTHPYKQIIWKHVDRPLMEGHERIGSYNTLKFLKDEILGANTDYTGFIRAYKSRLGDRDAGSVIICGAGGVGRAVALALVELNAREIKLFDPNEQQAISLCEAVAERGVKSQVLKAADLEREMQKADGLANCTALGMHNHPGTAFPEAGIGRQKWAFDAVYTPLETPFLKTCRGHDIRCVTGFDLWIFQGFDAFRLFTGVTVDLTDKLLETAYGWLD